ncbi:MAG: multiubiquitin domain-containing protein [Cyanobacteria bacterium HKST-UBA02]|nr:multiubiquitin domain-containing protein [Cyanobacteria bacterium HKST-UBA02]
MSKNAHEVNGIEELDLEAWAKEHPTQPPPRCQRYRIRVDKSRFVVHDSAQKGVEILALVGYTPDKWNLAQKFPGGRREPIEPDQLVDFREPGIERFETSPKEVQAGG